MIDPLTFLVFVLATWRISSLLVNEDGPFFLFNNIRHWSGIRTRFEPLPSPQGWKTVQDIPDKLFSQILSCIWCCSMYVGAFWIVDWLIFPVTSLYLAFPFALSALAIFINLLVEKLKS